MSKRKPSYTRDNVPCSAKRAYVEAKGLVLGPCELKGTGCILVTLRQERPRNKHEREFVYWTRKLSLQVRACEVGAEATWADREFVASAITRTGQATFEVYGSPDDLEKLMTLPCVLKWDWMLSGAPSVRLSVAGSGPDKARATKPKPKAEVVWGGSPEDNGMTAKETELAKWESHLDAMGELVKGVACLPE